MRMTLQASRVKASTSANHGIREPEAFPGLPEPTFPTGAPHVSP